MGPVITLGAGGALVEVLADATSRLAPVGRDEAHEMIDELRAAVLLDGFRGAPRGDRDALAGVIVRVGAAVATWQDSVALLELNPIAVLEQGAVALDAVITPATGGPA
jgi:acetyltransferase